MKYLSIAAVMTVASLATSAGAQTIVAPYAPDSSAEPEKIINVSVSAQQPIGELTQLADAAEQAMANSEYEKAAGLFRRVFEAKNFEKLAEDRRHFILSSAAKIASMHSDFSHARTLYEQSSQSGLADGDDWMGRLNASWFLGDFDDAVASLSIIANHWPDELAYVSEWAMDSLLAQLRSRNVEAELAVLQTLFNTSWQTDLGLEPTHLWLRLIELLTQRNELQQALPVTSRIRDPLAVVTLLSDKRYASIVAAQPDWFSVEEAMDAGIIEARLAVDAHPHLLAPSVKLAQALLRADRSQEALLVINTHMARSALKSVIGDKLEDSLSETVRALTLKAVALISLGDIDAAAAALELASRQMVPKDRLEDLLSVAELQANLCLPQAALRTLERISARPEDSRSYFVRFMAARALGDSDAEQLALSALLQRATEAPSQAQRALLLVGDMDAAAELLIERINDPRQRSDALLELQEMADHAWPEPGLDWRAGMSALTSRADVRATLNTNGGRVADYEIFRWN